jgi:GMP synthase-like glutamine amidotransferase
LLGEISGGKVVKSSPPEIGILDIEINSLKKNDNLFCDFPKYIKALQWHSYEVRDLESNLNITLLGSSNSTKYQIFKYKQHAYGIQFHIEIKDDTVRQWECIPEYKIALEESLGIGALERFDIIAKDNMEQMNHLATIMYENFIKLINKKQKID